MPVLSGKIAGADVMVKQDGNKFTVAWKKTINDETYGVIMATISGPLGRKERKALKDDVAYSVKRLERELRS